MLEVRITGGDQLRRVVAQIRAEGNRGLGKDMTAGLRLAAKPVQAAITAEFTQVLPSRGGYQATASKSVRFRTAVRTAGRTATFRLTTYAVGKSQRRDIEALNAGRLRHPVYGRSRPRRGGGRHVNPWALTRIEAGFFQRGTDRAVVEAQRQMGAVLDDYAARLAKG
jgi:hypothetical protein